MLAERMQLFAAKDVFIDDVVLAAGGSVAKWAETATAVVPGTQAVYSSTTTKGCTRWTEKNHFSTASVYSGQDGKPESTLFSCDRVRLLFTAPLTTASLCRLWARLQSTYRHWKGAWLMQQQHSSC
jgi:hypothetical protein